MLLRKFLIAFMTLISAVAYAQSDEVLTVETVDICDRGAFGVGIVWHTEAPSCHEVSVEKMAAMTGLYIDDSHLTEIPENALEGLSSLQVLYLDYNDITTIKANAFKDAPALKNIHIGYNKIEVIEAQAFAGLPNLETLNLEESLVRSISRAEVGLGENVVVEGLEVLP